MHNPKGLRRLIIGCLDDERALHYESSHVDLTRQLVLSRLADERAHFADELRTLADPGVRASASWLGRVREWFRMVWVLARGCNSGDAIAVCRRSGSRTEALYSKAIKRQWSEPILPTLLEQRDRIRHSAAELSLLQY